MVNSLEGITGVRDQAGGELEAEDQLRAVVLPLVELRNRGLHRRDGVELANESEFHGLAPVNLPSWPPGVIPQRASPGLDG